MEPLIVHIYCTKVALSWIESAYHRTKWPTGKGCMFCTTLLMLIFHVTQKMMISIHWRRKRLKMFRAIRTIDILSLYKINISCVWLYPTGLSRILICSYPNTWLPIRRATAAAVDIKKKHIYDGYWWKRNTISVHGTTSVTGTEKPIVIRHCSRR